MGAFVNKPTLSFGRNATPFSIWSITALPNYVEICNTQSYDILNVQLFNFLLLAFE